ncbi:MAG: hypothetical protein U0797_19265 [Gemmataceae bacterium]
MLDTGYGADSTRPYLVLEHVEGRSLAEVVFDSGSLPPEEWVEACRCCGVFQGAARPGLLQLAVRPAPSCSAWSRTATPACGPSSCSMPGWPRSGPSSTPAASVPEVARGSGVGRTVARLVPYSPEVVGRPKGQVWVGLALRPL